jgi:hypothetical protein
MNLNTILFALVGKVNTSLFNCKNCKYVCGGYVPTRNMPSPPPPALLARHHLNSFIEVISFSKRNSQMGCGL